MKPIFLYILIIFLGLSSCEKVFIGRLEDKLPEETSEGVGTLGCIINGKVWIPVINRDISPFKEETTLFMDEATGTIRINGISLRNDETGQIVSETILIDAYGIKNEGRYELIGEPLYWGSTLLFINNELEQYGGAAFIEEGPVSSFQSTGELKGKERPLILEIKRLDFENGICSGTFEFLAHNYVNSQKVLKKDVKRGRFDLQISK